MNQAIQVLAVKLTISARDLKRLERKFAQHDEADAKLERHLLRIWNEMRDRTRYLHLKTKDDPANATTIMQLKSPPANPPEPERIPKALEDEYTRQAAITYGIVKAEEQAKRRERSLAQQVRQTCAEARKAGRDVSPHVARIEAELQQMKRVA